MYHHIRGKLFELNPTYAVVESGGLGYHVEITLPTYTTLQGQQEVMLYLYPIFKEDNQQLFGFGDKSERQIFAQLLSVSGVGGNTARLILSSLSAAEVQGAIGAENAGALQAVKGVGAKTAQRIIIDLKDKIGLAEATAPSGGASQQAEALSALETLGYPSRQAQRVLRLVEKEQPGSSVEDLIKNALKKL